MLCFRDVEVTIVTIETRKMTAITIVRKCPDTSCRGRLSTIVTAAGPLDARCHMCAAPAALDIPDDLANLGRVTRCAACSGREFFIRKDFPQKLGLALVVAFGLIATAFYAYERVGLAFATLAALVVIDAGIYLFVGRVTVCYRCRAEYRGVAYNPDHKGFDLATSEKY